MHCNNCGKEIIDDAKVCDCGGIIGNEKELHIKTQDIPVDNEMNEEIIDNATEDETQVDNSTEDETQVEDFIEDKTQVEDLQDTNIVEAVDKDESKEINDIKDNNKKNNDEKNNDEENNDKVNNDEENNDEENNDEENNDKEVYEKEVKEIHENKETQERVNHDVDSDKQEKINVDASLKEDLQKNKAVFILSYLGFLFFLPLIVCSESKVGRFHANQGLVLLLTSVAGQIIHVILQTILPLSFWGFLSFIFSIWGLGLFALMVLGMINASKGEQKPLPIIGGIQLIK